MRHAGCLALLSVLSVACGGSSDADDGTAALGARGLPGYRIDAAAVVTLLVPGFGVSTKGAGQYRLVWQGTSAEVLEGSITTDGAFANDRTSPLGGKELVANQPDLISFRLNPSASLNGLDLITSGGPIYLDLSRNAERAQASLTLVREGRPQLSAHNPVAIEIR